jgi:hypothetical protein
MKGAFESCGNQFYATAFMWGSALRLVGKVVHFPSFGLVQGHFLELSRDILGTFQLEMAVGAAEGGVNVPELAPPPPGGAYCNGGPPGVGRGVFNVLWRLSLNGN